MTSPRLDFWMPVFESSLGVKGRTKRAIAKDFVLQFPDLSRDELEFISQRLGLGANWVTEQLQRQADAETLRSQYQPQSDGVVAERQAKYREQQRQANRQFREQFEASWRKYEEPKHAPLPDWGHVQRNPYLQRYLDLLGLRSPFTLRQLRAAYRRKATEFHPDASTGSHESFLRLKDAYDKLRCVAEEVSQ